MYSKYTTYKKSQYFFHGCNPEILIVLRLAGTNLFLMLKMQQLHGLPPKTMFSSFLKVSSQKVRGNSSNCRCHLGLEYVFVS